MNKLFTSQGAFAQRDYGGKGNFLVLLKECFSGFHRIGFGNVGIPKTCWFKLDQIQNELQERIPSYSNCLKNLSLPQEPTEWLLGNPVGLGELKQEILLLEMTAKWEQVCANVIRQLGPRVIVRSSMDGEDHENCSFAGCFESVVVLDATPNKLWVAIKQVLASGFNKNGMMRLMELGLSPSEFRPGFIIQEYVQGIYSGVCFSRDPNSLWEKRACLEWSAQGSSVVQGTGQTQKIRETEHAPIELQPFIGLLWKTVAKLEKVFRRPIDMEWVWDGRQIWLVQVRPIATEEAELVGRTRPGRRWSRELTLERFPEALTPMGWSALEDVFATNLEVLRKDFGVTVSHASEAGTCYGGYVYSDPDLFQFPVGFKSGVRIRWSHYFAPWKVSFWRFIGAIAKWIWRSSTLSQETSKAILGVAVGDALLGKRAEKQIDSWENHRNTCLAKIENFNHQLKKSELASPDEVLVLMEDLRKLSIEFMEPDLAIYLMKDSFFKSLKALWASFGNAELEFTTLVNSFEGNRTLQMNKEWEAFIDALSALARMNSSLDSIKNGIDRLRQSTGFGDGLAAFDGVNRECRELWKEFLVKNGHNRTTWDVAVPSWGEDPSQLADLILASLACRSKQISLAKPISTNEKIECKKRFYGQLKELGLKSSIPLIEKTMLRLENLMRMDEEQHFLSGILLEPSRKLIQRSEAILMQAHILHETDSVYFLKLDELKRQLVSQNTSLYFLTRKRKSEWQRNFSQPKPMELPPTKNGAEIKSVNCLDSNSKKIIGQAVSPGKATGPVYWAEHLGDLNKTIPLGAVLVTTSPNPALTPAYPILSGLITATGGPLSHGFVAAREYGLPAVSGIKDVRTYLQEGTWVSIDGSLGIVEIMEPESQEQEILT